MMLFRSHKLTSRLETLGKGVSSSDRESGNLEDCGPESSPPVRERYSAVALGPTSSGQPGPCLRTCKSETLRGVGVRKTQSLGAGFRVNPPINLTSLRSVAVRTTYVFGHKLKLNMLKVPIGHRYPANPSIPPNPPSLPYSPTQPARSTQPAHSTQLTHPSQPSPTPQVDQIQHWVNVLISFKWEDDLVMKVRYGICYRRLACCIRRYKGLSKTAKVSLFDSLGMLLNFEGKVDEQRVNVRFDSTFGGENAPKKNPGILSILYSNVSGGLGSRMNTEKKEAIKASGHFDDILILNETNCITSDALYIAKYFGIDARISDLSQVTYKQGARKPVLRKLTGYGTAVISKRGGLLQFSDVVCQDDPYDFEIVAAVVRWGNDKGVCIGAYRSPSMTQHPEIEAFYKKLAQVIGKAEQEGCKFIIVAMDDNKTTPYVNELQTKLLIKEMGLTNLIGQQITRERSATQPDSILAKYEPLACRIEANVVARITKTMDHRAIRIRIHSSNIVPRNPVYRTIERRVRCLGDDVIADLLSDECSKFVEEFKGVCDADMRVDTMSTSFMELIQRVKAKAWSVKKVRIPDCLPDTADKWVVRIGIEHARMEKLGIKLQGDPSNKEATKKFQEAQERCLKYIREKRDADCDRDLKYNRDRGDGINMSNFYRWCDKYISNKNSYLSEPYKILSDQEKATKLRDHDATFISDSVEPSDMETQLDEPVIMAFTLDAWDPSVNPGALSEFIKARTKIDVFFKVNASIIEEPLFIILKAIQLCAYYPKCMRTSRATFIPGRTIFSLETVTKIIEGVLSIEFSECTERFFQEHGDPDGFAYRRGRGVESCVLMFLSTIEKMPREDMLDCVVTVADLKKAFNSAKRASIVREAQKIAKAGRIMMTRWQGRTYTFEGEVRGIEYNRGTDAGAGLSVWGFDRWISTDMSCQSKSYGGAAPVIMKACNYSDDRNPSSSGTNVANGRYQREVLDEMHQWADAEGANFHLSGKKAPGLLIFKQKVGTDYTKVPNGISELKLCGQTIDVTDRQKILGMVISTRPNTGNKTKSGFFKTQEKIKVLLKQSRRIIDSKGYFAEPDLNYLVNSGYRFQQLRGEIEPHRMWTAVMSYFVGKLRFAVAFHWLRCTRLQLNTMRFYFCMAMSAIVDKTAYETVGAAACAARSVAEDNESYKKLCRVCKMPSLKELAVNNARTNIIQIFNIDYSWFACKNKRAWDKELVRIERLKAEGRAFYPSFIDSKVKGTIIEELWELGKRDAPVIPEGKDIYEALEIDTFTRDWDLALEAVTEKGIRKGKSKYTHGVFDIKAAHTLGILEPNDRKLRRRTPTKPLIQSRVCTVYPPDVDGCIGYYYKDLSIVVKYTCRNEADSIKLKCEQHENESSCRICMGPLLRTDKSGVCFCIEKCGEAAHKHCLKKCYKKDLFSCDEVHKTKVCENVGKRRVRSRTSRSRRAVTGSDRCIICGDIKSALYPLVDQRIAPFSDEHDWAWIECETLCGFGWHKTCSVIAKEANANLDSTNTVKEQIVRCEDVQYWIDRPTVTRLAGKLSNNTYIQHDLDDLLLGSFIEPVRQHTDGRKRRYNNGRDEFDCEICGEEVPLEQEDHLWSWCSGLPGSPPSKDPLESARKIKRRCLEIYGKIHVSSSHTGNGTNFADARNVARQSMTYASVTSKPPSPKANSIAHRLRSRLTNERSTRDQSQGQIAVTQCHQKQKKRSRRQPIISSPQVPTHISTRNRFDCLVVEEAPPSIIIETSVAHGTITRTKRKRTPRKRTMHANLNYDTDNLPSSANTNSIGDAHNHAVSRGPTGPLSRVDSHLTNPASPPYRLRRMAGHYRPRSSAPSSRTEKAYSKEPNNPETLAKSRGVNFRMTLRDRSSKSHSEVPD